MARHNNFYHLLRYDRVNRLQDVTRTSSFAIRVASNLGARGSRRDLARANNPSRGSRRFKEERKKKNKRKRGEKLCELDLLRILSRGHGLSRFSNVTSRRRFSLRFADPPKITLPHPVVTSVHNLPSSNATLGVC